MINDSNGSAFKTIVDKEVGNSEIIKKCAPPSVVTIFPSWPNTMAFGAKLAAEFRAKMVDYNGSLSKLIREFSFNNWQPLSLNPPLGLRIRSQLPKPTNAPEIIHGGASEVLVAIPPLPPWAALMIFEITHLDPSCKLVNSQASGNALPLSKDNGNKAYLVSLPTMRGICE